MNVLIPLLELFKAELPQPPGRVHRATRIGYKEMPPDASLMHEARLIVCLRGAAHFLAQQAQGPETITLNAGEGLFIAPGRWIQARPRRAYLTLGIVFTDVAPRCYFSRSVRRAGEGWSVRLPAQVRWPRPLTEEARALCRLLERDGGGEAYYHALFEALLLHCRQAPRPQTRHPQGKALLTWQAAAGFLADHLHEPIGREEVAAQLRIHPNHLSRLCMRFTQASFARYLQDLRLERGRILLADPGLNVEEIAARAGFGSANYFIRLYRRRYGKTPAADRG